MRHKLVTVALAGSLGLTGAVLLSPSLASAATGSPAAADRVSAIRKALEGLVSDKTLTPAQADKVAGTLAQQLPPGGPGPHDGFRHHGGPGAHLSREAVASALGVTVDELRTAQQAGKTLTQIAASKGISKATLVDRLVTAAKAELAADVKAGRLTQAQADAVSRDLTARITARVDRVGGPGEHGGPGGPRWGDHDGDGPGAPGGTTAPAPSQTPSRAPAPGSSVAPSGTTTTGATVSA
jgi:hypothetical protein